MQTIIKLLNRAASTIMPMVLMLTMLLEFTTCATALGLMCQQTL